MKTEENKLPAKEGQFKGKVVFITGGATGIGLATAIAFVKQGARVAIAGRSEHKNEEVLKHILREGGDAIAVKCDVQEGEDIKAALDHVTDNIRINVVAPGMIDTPMMDRFTGGTEEGRIQAIAQEPIGRAGRPEEIANCVIWLCSDASSFVTGHTLVADGGQTV